MLNELTSLEKKLNNLIERLEVLKKENDNLKPSLQLAQEEIQNLNSQMIETKRDLGTLAAKIDDKKVFENVDIVLNWHPSNSNRASAGSSLANKTGKFRFSGVSAHAAGAPQRGRSALDGIEAMNNMLNMMREHVDPESRIHYIITKGGDAPNVVPNFAEGYYYVRHPNPEEVRRLWKRLELCAKGAALGTETTYTYEVTGGVYNILPNEVLQKIIHKNLSDVGGVKYNKEELAYAEAISLTFGDNKKKLSVSEEIQPYVYYKETKGGGSTDVGDVSWAVPTGGFGTATYVPGTAGHSWQAASCTGTSIGTKGMLNAAKVMALTAYDLSLIHI
mgnify:CR=1 FL=1